MSKNQIPAVFVLLLLLFLVSIFQNQAHAQRRYPVIRPSNVVDEIYAMKQKNPRMSAAALAARGNALIKRKGYDFSTLDCAVVEANGKSADEDGISEQETPFKYDLEILPSGKKTFQIMAKYWSAPCGCSLDLPVLQIRANQWTTLADGKPLVLKRPKDFYFIEVKMLDKTFKKTVKTFYKPLDNEVVGISADGTKIYTELSYDGDVDVMLEISDRGTFQIVPSKAPNIIRKTVELTSEQMQQHRETSEIHHFKEKNKSYFLHYYAPCT